MKTKIIFLLSLLPALFFGQTDLVKWEGSTSSLNLNPTILVTTFPEGISSASISTGTTPLISSEAYEGFTFTNWSNSSTLINTQYIQFQISAIEGYQIELEKLIFWVKIDQGAEKYQVHYSKSSNFSGEQSILLGEETATNNWVKKELSFTSGYLLLSNETLYIRIYGYKPVNPYWSGHRFTLGYQSNGPTITGTVSVATNAPIAIADSVNTVEEIPVNIDILANDIFTEQVLDIEIEQPENGVVTVNYDENDNPVNVTYTPNDNFYGIDTFSYTIEDEEGTSNSADVTITVTQGVSPTATADTATTVENQNITIQVLANDDAGNAPITNVSVSSLPAHGTAVVNPNKTITYTPDSEYTGTDSFQYTATNMYGTSSPVTVSITIEAGQAPTASLDNQSVPKNQNGIIDVLANDNTGNAPVTNVAVSSSPAHGTAVVNPDKTITYTPDLEYTGTDSFQYTVTNMYGTSSPATVNITVQETTPGTIPLCGMYSIGEAGDFTTLTSAVNYLNTYGVSCPVTFLLDKDLFENNTENANGEVFPLTINEFAGSSATNTVTFKPAPNRNSVTIKVNNVKVNNNYIRPSFLFRLNGADNIIFDGSNNGTSSKNITLLNNNNNVAENMNSLERTVLWLADATDNITLKNLIIMQGEYNSSSAFAAGIMVSKYSNDEYHSQGIPSDNPATNITVENNLFQGVKQGFYLINSGTFYSTNINVYNNDFGTEAGVDKITHSIHLGGVQGFNVYKNIIYDLDIDFTGGANFGGIVVVGNSINGKIYKNQIQGVDRTTGHEVSGIKLASSNTSNDVNISVTNNFIADIRTLGGGDWNQSAHGIYITQGKGYKIYHNSVNMSYNTATGGSTSSAIGIASRSGTPNNTGVVANLDVRNNIFIYSAGNAGNSGWKTAIMVDVDPDNNFNTVFSHLNHNNYWVNETQSRSYTGAYGNDLTWYNQLNNQYKKSFANWQAASQAPQDGNSGSENTPFVSNFNLHISNNTAWVNNNGVSLASEFDDLGLPYDDIDGQPRSTTMPDIGADEFGVPPAVPGVCEVTLYWNGTSWGDENGDTVIVDGEEITEPTRDFLTEIRGAYDTEEHGSFSTCELTIGTGGSLRIDGDDYVFIVNRFINTLAASAVIVENNGSIVQETDFNENTGEITYKRKAMPMYNFDYTYWGSPVTGQTTATLSPNSGGYSYRWNPEVYYNSTYGMYLQRRWGDENNDFAQYPGVMEPGHGYIIKAPNNFPNNTNVNPSTFTANFKGIPNSGQYDIATVGDPGNQLNGDSGNDPGTGYPQGDFAWNFFGNPYPSAIDVEKFRAANNQVLGDNVYLWSHNTKPVPGQIYYQYVANDFAVYNAKLGQSTCATPFPEGDTSINPNYNKPTRFIAAGQGFFMPAKTGSVQFNNSMRVSDIGDTPNSIMPNNQFFKVQNSTNSSDQNTEEKHNIKLSIRNEQGAFHQTLLGYVADASNDLDNVDGVIFGGNYVSLYSVVENYHLVVQGRGLPFTETDQVPLGFSLYISGDFSIHLDYFDGLFEEDNQNQNIYLYDSYLNLTHNLKDSPYEFASDEGTFNDRFVLKYMSSLSIDDINSIDNHWMIYKKDNQLQFISNGFDFKNIAVYDMLGRIVYQENNINSNRHAIERVSNNQVLIVKITSADNITSVKKVHN